jgi:hypothetical protein
MDAYVQTRWLDRRIAELAERDHGIVDVEGLRAVGASRTQIGRRLYAMRFVRLYRGVYAVGHRKLTNEGWWLAAVRAIGRGAVLSHRSYAGRPRRSVAAPILSRALEAAEARHLLDVPSLLAVSAGRPGAERIRRLVPEHKLVVELDSWRHHGTRAAFERDRERDAELHAHGSASVRFTYRQVTTRSRWVANRLVPRFRDGSSSSRRSAA